MINYVHKTLRVLSAVIIIVHASCLLGGCMYSLDGLIGVILQLINIKYVQSKKCDQRGASKHVPVLKIYKVLYIYVVYLLVWIINTPTCFDVFASSSGSLFVCMLKLQNQ